MPSPSIQELRNVIEAVGAMTVEADSIAVASADSRVLGVAHAWCTQVVRYAKAVLALVDANLAAEAHPIARSALEYAATLHWLVQTGDEAVDAVLAEHQRVTAAASNDATGGAFEAALTELAREDTLAPVHANVNEVLTLRRFKELCEKFGLNDLYVMYRIECGFAHPRWSAVALYTDAVDGLRLLDHPREDHSSPVVGTAACSLVWAVSALDDAIEGHPLRERLGQLAGMLGIPPRLPPAKTTA